MKKLSLPVLFLLMATLSSCDAIVGIFKAGAITGVIAVVVVIILILWLLSKFRSRN